MFSPWTEVQGQVGDLGQQRRQELQEQLLRQEKILSNRGLLQTLPDKGKKIKEFAEKLRLAIERHDEEGRRQSPVSDTRAEHQSKYQQSVTAQKRAVSILPAASHHNQQSEASAASAYMKEKTISDRKKDQSFSTVAAIETKETATAGASLNSDLTTEHFLVDSLEKITLSDTGTGLSIKPKEPLNSIDGGNYFASNKTPKKPHIVAILEKNEQFLEPRKEKFKPNQLLQRNDIPPSGSSSPSHFTEESSPQPLSVQARRERDRKHLDDITAARLPPLHHNPAQLLTLEESAVLLKEQAKKQQEMQAKLAAQKLSQELKISMGSYTPDGGLMAAYREVRDEGDQLSDED